MNRLNIPRRRLAAASLVIVIASVLVPIMLLGETAWMVALPLSTLAIFGYFHLKGSIRNTSGLWPKESASSTILIAAGYAIVIFLVFKILLEPYAELISNTPRDLSRLDSVQGSISEMVFTLLIVWITAAFYEELFYRAFMIRAVAEALGDSTAGWVIGIICSAALFSYAHGYQGPAGLIVTALGALVLTAIYLKHRQNLWIPIITHGIFDSGTVVLAYFGLYDEFTHLIIQAPTGG